MSVGFVEPAEPELRHVLDELQCRCPLDRALLRDLFAAAGYSPVNTDATVHESSASRSSSAALLASTSTTPESSQ